MSAIIKSLKKYNVLQLKTTGAFPSRGAKILEISVLKIENEQIIETLTTLIQPERLIPKKMQIETGITDQLVSQAPNFQTIAPRLLAFLGDQPIVTCQARLEIERFLRLEFYESGYELSAEIIDLQVLAKAHTQAKASKHDLSTLVQRFELERMQPYRAEPDGKLVWQLFQLLTTWQQVQQLEMPEKVAVETSVFTEAETQRLKIVKAATTAQPILTLLAADPLEAIREQAQQQLFARFEVVFDHADVQEAWIEAAQSQAYRVRMHVASLPQLPLEMMKILVRDSTVSVRKTLASNQNVPTSIAEQLLNDKAVNVREQAFNNTGIAPLLLAKHPKITLEQLLILVKHEDGSVRQAVGGHKTSNEAILLHLVADPIVKIATAAQVRLLKTATLTSELKVLLLTAPHVTSEIFDTFGDDQNVQVRKALITHKQIPLALILALLDDQQHEIAYVAKQKLHERATHPNTQAHELELLAECGDYSIQQAIASHPQTPPKTLGQLANLSFDNFSELKIGKALAANPQTPMGILLKLARIKSLRTQVYETITKKR